MMLQGAGLGYRRDLAEDFYYCPTTVLSTLWKWRQKIGSKWEGLRAINLIKRQNDFPCRPWTFTLFRWTGAFR